MNRKADIKRKTAETEISLHLELDQASKIDVDTGCGFLNHMLTLFAKHGNFGLCVNCKGDTDVDYHHTVEDVAICLGQTLRTALGDKRGINRYGSILLPMDEALILCSLDLSGRCGFYPELSIPTQKVGDFDTELCEEFFMALAREAGLTLHLRQMAGRNSHHIIEGCFKSAGRALRQAAAPDAAIPDSIPSSKGVL